MKAKINWRSGLVTVGVLLGLAALPAAAFAQSQPGATGPGASGQNDTSQTSSQGANGDTGAYAPGMMRRGYGPGMMWGRGNGPGSMPYGYGPGRMWGGRYGPGMMRYGYGPEMMWHGYGPGMMGRGNGPDGMPYGYGPGRMWGGGYGPGMMRYGYGPGMMWHGYGPGMGWGAYGSAGRRPYGTRGYAGYALTGLKLTPEQRKKISALRRAQFQHERKLHVRLYHEMHRLRAAMMSEPPSLAAVGKAFDRLSATRKEMVLGRAHTLNRINGVLTPAQRKKLRSRWQGCWPQSGAGD